jgi:hypothetical protein
MEKIMAMAGGKENLVRLIVPEVDWTLNIILVTNNEIEDIYESYNSDFSFHYKVGMQNLLFIQEEKSVSLLNGVTVSSWVKGDPQVGYTKLSYDVVSQYKSTYGSGYGSRPRSSCLDSVNSPPGRGFTMV